MSKNARCPGPGGCRYACEASVWLRRRWIQVLFEPCLEGGGRHQAMSGSELLGSRLWTPVQTELGHLREVLPGDLPPHE